MRKAWLAILLGSLLMLAWSGSARALEFSALVARQMGGQEALAQVYIKGPKVRMDQAGQAQAGAPVFYHIMRQDLGVSWLVYPQQGVYYEAPLQQGMDLSRPPAEGDKLPGEVSRQDMGPEVVEGVATRKYQITYNQGGYNQVIWYWYAKDLGLPLRTGAVDGSWLLTYRQVKKAPQPDSLFELPAGLRKLDPPAGGAQGSPGQAR